MDIDQQASSNFFQQVHMLWIEPEIQRRRAENRLKEGFQISQCLIKFPKGQSHIVEFNGEIRWRVDFKHIERSSSAPESGWPAGQGVFLHEVEKIKQVDPPCVNGIRVAFVYIYFTGMGYQALFDFSPNDPLYKSGADLPWTMGETIADYLNEIFKERALQFHDKAQLELRNIGLWAVPALLPFPMTLIIKQLMEDKNPEAARQTLVRHCDANFIGSLISKWWSTEQLTARKPLIEDSYDAHCRGQYRLSIHALLPQIEGIVTEWVITRLPDESSKPFRLESKARKFRDLVSQEAINTFYFQRVLNSSIDFILSGPVLASFTKWLEDLDNIFPNRHAVEHGKYDDSIFTQENSIKLFLMIDTIAHVAISPKKPQERNA